MNKIGLINYEGNCLEAIKNGDLIYIKDQYGVELRVITPMGLLNFMDGEFDIVDSRGNKWNYPSESEDSKPRMSKVYEFLDYKNNLYSEIESLIIHWSIDGTRTAGSLTREIMKLL